MHALSNRRRWLGGAALALLFGPVGAAAQRVAPSELNMTWGTARLVGEGRLRHFGLHVYDIRLWSVEPQIGAEDWPVKPLALEIEYARALVGRLIAERSLQEMRRGGPLGAEAAQRWLDTMTTLFPDVEAGDRLTGVQAPGGVSRFFHNGRPRGDVRDADFTRRFFGIWLAEHTSEPGLRASLLGRR